MSNFKVKVIDMIVSEWDSKNGTGDTLFSKGGFTIGTYNTIEEAKAAINEYFDYELPADNYNGEFIRASQIENAEAYADNDGDYLVDYTLQIIEQKPVNFGGDL